MSTSKLSIESKLSAIGGLIASLIALLVLIPKLFDAIKAIVGLPGYALCILLILIAIIGIVVCIVHLRVRSRFINHDALLLKPDNPEHLIGRSEDIDRIYKLCKKNRQVNLIGESGSGKSSLLISGLIPKTVREARLFPIYIDNYGDDWESGPSSSLRFGIIESINKYNYKNIDITKDTKEKDLMLLVGFIANSGLLPLIIFDQLDDYIIGHRDKIIGGKLSTWISNDILVSSNKFWEKILQLIGDNKIHILFSIRSDLASGLETFRFVQPFQTPLYRIQAHYIKPFLTQLTTSNNDSKDVIYKPDKGWDNLKTRISKDLSIGGILPAQLKIVLQGLSSLNYLTIREYIKKGSLEGLESGYIQQRINNTAEYVQLDKGLISYILYMLVDLQSFKTIPKSIDRLVEDINDTFYTVKNLREKIKNALKELEQNGIVSRVIDRESMSYGWKLCHDYLCSGVIDAEYRQYNFVWSINERLREYSRSKFNVIKKYRLLLSPWGQIKIIYFYLKGEIRLSNIGNYLVKSFVFKFMPIIFVFISVIIIRQCIKNINNYYNAVDDIRSSWYQVTSMLINQSCGTKSFERQELVSIVLTTLEDLWYFGFIDEEDTSIKDLFSSFANAVTEAENIKLADKLFEQLNNPLNRIEVRRIVKAIEGVLSDPRPSIKKQLLNKYLIEMRKATDNKKLYDLILIMENKNLGFNTQQRIKLSSILLNIIENSGTEKETYKILGAISKNIDELSLTQELRLEKLTLQLFLKANDVYDLNFLYKVVKSKPFNLSIDNEEVMKAHIIDVLKDKNNKKELYELTKLLNSFSITKKNYKENIYPHLHKTIINTNDIEDITFLSNAIGEFQYKLLGNSTGQVLNHILKLIDSSDDFYDIGELFKAFLNFEYEIKEDDYLAVIRKILSLIKSKPIEFGDTRETVDEYYYAFELMKDVLNSSAKVSTGKEIDEISIFLQHMGKSGVSLDIMRMLHKHTGYMDNLSIRRIVNIVIQQIVDESYDYHLFVQALHPLAEYIDEASLKKINELMIEKILNKNNDYHELLNILGSLFVDQYKIDNRQKEIVNDTIDLIILRNELSIYDINELTKAMVRLEIPIPLDTANIIIMNLLKNTSMATDDLDNELENLSDTLLYLISELKGKTQVDALQFAIGEMRKHLINDHSDELIVKNNIHHIINKLSMLNAITQNSEYFTYKNMNIGKNANKYYKNRVSPNSVGEKKEKYIDSQRCEKLFTTTIIDINQKNNKLSAPLSALLIARLSIFSENFEKYKLRIQGK